MTDRLRALLIAVIAVVVLAAAPARAERADVGRAAPLFEAKTLAGQPVALADLKGKVLLMDFWASWCEPCREEFPEFEAMYKEFRDRGVEIVAVSVDRKRENALEFVAKHPVTFTVVHDQDRSIADRYKPRAMPTAYVIDQKGMVRFVHLGYQKSYLAAYREEITKLLAEGPTP
ncbi:MAG: TlpA family protein disulfide reductase [Nitrospirota bacterium]